MKNNRLPTWSDDAPAITGSTTDDVVDTGHIRRQATIWTVALMAITLVAIMISANWGNISSLPDRAASWAVAPVERALTPSVRDNDAPLAYLEAPHGQDEPAATTDSESEFDFTLGDEQTVEEACKSLEPVFSDCNSPQAQECQLPDGTWLNCKGPAPSTQSAPTATDTAEQKCNTEHGQIVCVPADDTFGTQPIGCTPTGNVAFPKADDWTLTCQLDDKSMLRISKSDWYMLFIYDDPYRTIELSIYKDGNTNIHKWDRQDSSDRSYMIQDDDAYRSNCDLKFVNGGHDTSQSCTVLINVLHDFKIDRTIDTERGGAKYVSVHVQVVGQAWGYFRYSVGDLAPSSVSLTQEGGYVPN